VRAANSDTAVAVLHNAIHPHAPLAQLAVAIALDAVDPIDRADFSIRLDAGTRWSAGSRTASMSMAATWHGPSR
jgi:hypothetical protein